MEYRVVSEASSKVAAEGAGVVVSHDYNVRRKCAIPTDIAANIRVLESWGADDSA
jgi:acyl-CoA thioesterase FadM